MKLDLYFIPYTEINSNWVKDKKSENIIILEEHMGENLYNTGIGNDFMDVTDTKSTWNKNKNKQVRLHQTKKLLHSKRNY